MAIYKSKCIVCGSLTTSKWVKNKRYCSKSCQFKGNNFRVGKKPTNAFKKGELVNEKHPNWKGNKALYGSKHDWVVRKLGRPKQCENCGTTSHKQFEWANLSGEYKRDISDWARLCKMCHALIDNSMRGLNRKGGILGRKWKAKAVGNVS